VANRRTALALSLAVPTGLTLLWFLATSIGGVKSYQFASPADVTRELGTLASNGLLWRHLAASIERVLLGFGFSLALAIALATVVGLSRPAEAALEPTLQMIRSIPSLAWVPLLLLWLGIGENAKVTLIAIGAFFPIYVNLVSGIRNVDRKLVEVGQVLGLGYLDLARRIILPAALPSLLVGARIGLTQAWLFLVAAELLASTRGLGFMLSEGQQIARTDEIITAIMLLALCGKLSESIMRAIESRLLHWTDGLPA
jgi:sulfonate transport system permease protein